MLRKEQNAFIARTGPSFPLAGSFAATDCRHSRQRSSRVGRNTLSSLSCAALSRLNYQTSKTMTSVGVGLLAD